MAVVRGILLHGLEPLFLRVFCSAVRGNAVVMGLDFLVDPDVSLVCGLEHCLE